MLLLPQAAVLPESDAGSDGVEPTSGFVIKNHANTYFMSCPIQGMGHAVKTWSAVCSMALHSQSGKGARPHHVCTKEIAQHQFAGD